MILPLRLASNRVASGNARKNVPTWCQLSPFPIDLPAKEKTEMKNVVVPLLLLLASWQAPWARAEDAKTPYPSMAPLDQYLMERSAEIALARTAAPESISADAEVIVLGQHGYETAVKGKNGFVCMVQRSWFKETDDPEFWNPKLRAPICFNPAGARFNVPVGNKRTELILAGRSAAQMSEGIEAAFNKKELPTPEPGAMCYMMSKQQYLGDDGGHWHPHLMFFVPPTDPGAWGADLPGSPVIAAKDTLDRVTVFMIPVRKWSDGTADTVAGQ